MKTGTHATGHPAKALATHGGHYRRFAWMVALMFVAMYALMYAMVDRFANVYNSVNQLYMALLMTAAMVVIELVVMASMYPSKRINAILLGISAVVLAGAWFGIREQAAVDDRQFLRSMIPHHAGAILMCEEASIRDERVQVLCAQIRSSQEREIALMKEMLAEVDRG